MAFVRFFAAAAVLSAGVCCSGAVGWRNLDESRHLAGRKASEGYLAGKVVLVDRWGARCPPCRRMLPEVEQIWRSFKTKPFVVVGGHCAGWGEPGEVKELADTLGLSYPIYEEAGLAAGEPQFDGIPFLYVVDETGRVVYRGRDGRKATQAVVTALTDMESPRNARQWRKFLDFEIKELPARALLRFEEFRKKHPAEAKEYAAAAAGLAKTPGVKELVALVKFAREAKDAPPFGEKQAAQKAKFAKSIEQAIAKYAPLAESSDRLVAREAKNAIADLKWALAAL